MPSFFPILIEVEELAVGRVLRKLNIMEGIVHIRLKLEEEKRPLIETKGQEVVPASPPWLSDNSRKAKPTSGRRFRGMPFDSHPVYQTIGGMLRHTPSHLRLIEAALEKMGLRRASVNGYMFRLMKNKMVVRTAPGTYKLTERGKAILKEAVIQKHPKASKYTNNHEGFRGQLLTMLKKERDKDADGVGLISNKDVTSFVESINYSSKNLSTQGMRMRHEGLIAFTNGFYSITEKGLAAISSPAVRGLIENNNREGMTANG